MKNVFWILDAKNTRIPYNSKSITTWTVQGDEIDEEQNLSTIDYLYLLSLFISLRGRRESGRIGEAANPGEKALYT